MNQVRYCILKPKVIDTLDFEIKRGKHKVFIGAKEELRYNKNKFFFQPKKGIVKIRGFAPKQLEGYKTYNLSELKKIISSSWGQWKLN